MTNPTSSNSPFLINQDWASTVEGDSASVSRPRRFLFHILGLLRQVGCFLFHCMGIFEKAKIFHIIGIFWQAIFCSIFFHVVLQQLIYFLLETMTTRSLWTTQISYICCSIYFHNDYVAVIMFFSSETVTLPSLWTTQETRTGMTNRSPINHTIRMEASLIGREAETSDILHTSLIGRPPLPPMYGLLGVSFRRSKQCFVWWPPSPKHTTHICASQPS